MKPSVDAAERMTAGHTACQGCGATISMRYALKGLGEDAVFAIPACCWTILAGAAPRSSLDVPMLHAPFAAAAATACGIKAGLVARGNDHTTVVAWGGDGGTFDIGLQSLSGAAERNEDILYVCYDNEAYMNTGIQRSGATPLGAWTTTTPVLGGSRGKAEPKKDVMAIVAAHRPAYAATVSPYWRVR